MEDLLAGTSVMDAGAGDDAANEAIKKRLRHMHQRPTPTREELLASADGDEAVAGSYWEVFSNVQWGSVPPTSGDVPSEAQV